MAASACGDRRGSRSTGPGHIGPGGAARQRAPRRLSSARARGVPHGGQIDQLVLTEDGTAALTRDNTGGVRLWARLDGTAQPVPIPIRAPAQMSLTRQGELLTAAMVDSAGGAHFLRLGDRGETTELSSLPPEYGVLELALLPGGKRALLLRNDRSIEMIDTATGTLVARTSRRQFSPSALLLSGDGNSAIAIELKDAGPPRIPTLHLYRVTWNASASPVTLTVTGVFRGGDGNLSLLPKAAAVNPSGTRFAYASVDPATNLVKVIAVDLGTGKETPFDLAMYIHERPVLGFGDDRELAVAADATARGWRIAVDSGRIRPRPMPSSQNVGSALHAFRRGVHVAALGTWLYVRDKKTRYLGFEPFEPTATAISPDNKWVAWANNRGQVYIEASAGTGDVFRLDSELWNGMWRLAFLDPEHLIAADQVGGLMLIAWRTGEVVARADAGGPVYTVEADAGRQLALVTRQLGGTWVYEVSARHGFAGPYVLDDGSVKAGILSAGTHAVWTLDGLNQRRVYTLAEIKSGLSRTEMIARAQKPYPVAPIAVDSAGRVYAYGNEGGRTAVAIHVGTDKPRHLPISGTQVMAAVPSPDGNKVAVLSDSGALTVFATGTGKVLWSYSLVQNTAIAVWSPDGSVLAAGGMAGAAVLSADSGRPSSVSCGPWFEIRETAPPAPFTSQVATMCAR